MLYFIKAASLPSTINVCLKTYLFYIQVKYADEINLEITETFTNTAKKFKAVKEEWHSVKLEIVKKTLSASVDGNEPQILVRNRVDLLVAKLSFGDPSHSCTTLIGCIKDMVSSV